MKTQMCSWGIGRDTVRTVHFEDKVAFLWVFLFWSFLKTLRPDWLVRQFIDSLVQVSTCQTHAQTFRANRQQRPSRFDHNSCQLLMR